MRTRLIRVNRRDREAYTYFPTTPQLYSTTRNISNRCDHTIVLGRVEYPKMLVLVYVTLAISIRRRDSTRRDDGNVTCEPNRAVIYFVWKWKRCERNMFFDYTSTSTSTGTTRTVYIYLLVFGLKKGKSASLLVPIPKGFFILPLSSPT